MFHSVPCAHNVDYVMVAWNKKADRVHRGMAAASGQNDVIAKKSVVQLHTVNNNKARASEKGVCHY